jgi:hypothetical protein
MPRLGLGRTERQGRRARKRKRAPPPQSHCSHFADNPLLFALVAAEGNRAIQPFQTFSLALGDPLRIKELLLDRFLACMKPASIT